MNLDNYATINQTHAHESRSERYGFTSTKQDLDILADHGWLPVKVEEVKTRTVSRQGFQKHIVKLRQSNQMDLKNVGDEILELILKGSHDGTSHREFMLGLFRLVCGNGAVAIVGNFGQFKIRHNKNASEEVSKALISILDFGPALLETVQQFKTITLSDAQQINYATEVVEMFNDAEKFVLKPVELLAARRADDAKPDLWTTFNRVQENVIRGGITRTTLEGKSRRTREVKNIDRNIKLNKALWDLTERTAQLLLN